MSSPTLFVALDGLSTNEDATCEAAARMSEEVEGNFGWKMNLDYLLAKGVPLVFGAPGGPPRPIFADTKTWNGKRTITDLAKMLVDADVDYFNVWVQADDQLEGAVKATEGSNTKILGVTVLTHYGDDWCKRYFQRSLEETVVFLTTRAKELGLPGVVLPGTCLPAVKGIDIIKAVPGIRMADFKDDRHQQEVTPEFAAQNGANIVVCGSPIMKVADKVAALRQVLSRLKSVA